jgi:Protein of unknown function (DUF2811)
MPNYTVSLEVEIDAEMHDAMQKILKTKQGWDQSQVLNAAIALYVMQQGELDAADKLPAKRIYLDSIF